MDQKFYETWEFQYNAEILRTRRGLNHKSVPQQNPKLKELRSRHEQDRKTKTSYLERKSKYKKWIVNQTQSLKRNWATKKLERKEDTRIALNTVRVS